MTTTDVPHFLTRIDRLERSVGRWRRITLCASCILGALFISGAQSKQTIVEAQRFVLIDADGKPRAAFHSDAAGPIYSGTFWLIRGPNIVRVKR